MTISKDLFLSILAMDSYNRGYGEAIEGLGGLGSTVGSATISTDSETTPSTAQGSQAAGFYAVSYTVGDGVDGIESGTTVISYLRTGLTERNLHNVLTRLLHAGATH